MSVDIQLLLRFNLTYFTTKSEVHQNPKYTMPLKYQTDQYPTHSTSTTQQIRPNSYVTWQLLYPNWLDLILSNTVLPCLTLLHQPLSLLSRTLSLYICIITLPLNSNFIQLCLHPNVYHTLLCLSLLHTRNLTFPFTTLFFLTHPPRLPFLNRYLHFSIDIHVLIPPFEMLS